MGRDAPDLSLAKAWDRLAEPGRAIALAGGAEPLEELKLGALLMGLVGGLALFLYGMEKMTDALKLIAGDRMKALLARMTSNRFKAVLTGATLTATVQSSSVTTVLVVGFISAGLLSLSQSIGIILGANIGTTITAQIIAFKVDEVLAAPADRRGLRHDLRSAARPRLIRHHGAGAPGPRVWSSSAWRS